MAIIERIGCMGLPLDEFVVIGSGLLDALGLRKSNDIDLVASRELYELLRSSRSYQVVYRGSREYLVKDDCEVWLDWGSDLTFDILKARSVKINGIMFVDKPTLLAKKRERGLKKDLVDIELLSGINT